LVERKALNLVVKGSSPFFGGTNVLWFLFDAENLLLACYSSLSKVCERRLCVVIQDTVKQRNV